MSDETLYKLVNPEFSFGFAGKTYELRRATLDKAVQYQKRVKELKGKGEESTDLLLVAYCIYIMLKDKAPDITEEFVLQNTPADIDVLECLAMLGFISPGKIGIIRSIQDRVTQKLTTENSLPS